MVIYRKKYIIVVVWAALLLSAGCASAPKQRDLTVKYYYTQTEDGISLALRRYQPKQLSPDKEPIILCHGLSYNLLFWDLSDEVSLPRYLANAGYDVWSLSLRGACPSSQPLSSAFRKLGHFHLEPELVRTMQKRLSGLKMTDWSVDDHINQDVGQAISFVLKKTEHKKVHWIGHSMGGMVMFGYLGQYTAQSAGQVESFVAVSVPMVAFHPLSDPFVFLLESQAALDLGSRIIGSSAPAAAGTIFGDTNTPMDKLFYNGQNMDDAIIREMFHVAQEEISPSQLKQLLNIARTEHFVSLKGNIDYTGNLSQITTPTCFLVGTVDNMATPGAVKFTYRQIKSRDKEFHMFGRVNSQRNDYGHDDIILGKNARQEVYPVILEWLENHEGHREQAPLMLQPKELSEAAQNQVDSQAEPQ